MIYWFTGQPGSGKTTMANWMKTHFIRRAITIDGDDIRDVFQNKDYSETGRKANIEKAQILAKFLHSKKFNVIVSLVSPYKDQREAFKAEMGEGIKEIYVHTTNERGREHFHVDNYEPPTENFIDLDTTDERELQTFKRLREYLEI